MTYVDDARRGLLAIDRLACGYLGLTGLFAIAFGGASGTLIAVIHLVVAISILRLGRWRARSGFGGFMRATYAVLLTPILYAELATLNRFLTERFFDGVVQGWDQALFFSQPSIELSNWLPSFLLSETLHLGYFAYYAIVPSALIGVYLTRGFAAAHRAAFTTALAFFLCYVTFAVFPVAGPRYEFEAIGGALGEGTFYRIVHAVLEGGSSQGTAFPSSHIAASLAAVLGAGREDRRWLWLLLIPEIALAVGTVYGRFHYAIDAVAGVGYALAAWSLTPWAVRVLNGGRSGT
jgi:membrane-associated phospholipid phosphatase